MNWDDLRYFLALAREGTVSGAGRVLKVRHTTVARRIAGFEDKLGSRLFDRMPSGYALTQVGENLVAHALGMEELVNAADREILGMDAQLRGTLTLASSYDLFNRLITSNIHIFTEKYPGIELELVSSTGLVDLASREADIAVRISPNPPDNLIGRKIASLAHGVYAGEGYLSERHSQDQLILWRHDTPLPEWAIDHFPGARIALRTSEVMTMVDAVKHNLGLARLPCYVADAEPELRRIDVALTPSDWGIWVLSHADLRNTARVRACREFLTEIIAQQRRLIEGLDSRY